MHKISQIVYELRDERTDKMIYAQIIPAFCAKVNFEKISGKRSREEFEFKEYEELSPEVKEIFRNLIYQKIDELECSQGEFFELYNFLSFINYILPEYESLFNRFFFRHRLDTEFMKQTYYLHYNYVSKEDLLRNFEFSSNNIEELLGRSPHEAYLFIKYSMPEDQQPAYFKRNWEQNQHKESYLEYARSDLFPLEEFDKLCGETYYKIAHYYASIIHEDPDNESQYWVSVNLLKQNWFKNRCLDSLHLYAKHLIEYDEPDDGLYAKNQLEGYKILNMLVRKYNFGPSNELLKDDDNISDILDN